MIIGISGSIGSGKDTVATIIVEQSQNQWKIKKFAGKLKQIVSLLTGCTVEDLENEEFKNSNLPSEWDIDGKHQQYRSILQKLGTELLRDGIHLDVHINALYSDYICTNFNYFTGLKGEGGLKEIKTKIIEPKWIITDLRFENEFESIKQRNGITIRVERYLTCNQWIKQLNVSKIEHYNDTLPITKSDFIKLLDGVGYRNPDFFKKHQHLSEVGLNQFVIDQKFDFVIKNDGSLDDLKLKVNEIIKQNNL